MVPSASSDEPETGSDDFSDSPSFDPALPVEVVFVDAGVEDAQTLLDGLRGDDQGETQWLVVELSADEDGVEQITRELSRLDGVDAVHILSHGDGKGIQLGNTRLDVDTATGYASDIASWADSLDADADLLIYGCDLASTVEGRDLIDSIGALCDCDVAASDDATGTESLGGDWELEYTVGSVDVGVAFNSQAQSNWHGLLATYTVTNTNVSGAGSLEQAILDSNASVGVTDTIDFNISTGDSGYRNPDAIPGNGDEYWTIRVASGGLTGLFDSVILDATTQPGYAGNPVIELNGIDTNSGVNGIQIRTSNSTIRGFAVRNFADEGIEADGSASYGGDNNLIENNWVGLDGTGAADGVAEHGIMLSVNADNNIVRNNVVVNSGFSGIIINDNSINNVIEGNYIGVGPDGTTIMGNGMHGVQIQVNSTGNTIGGTGAGDGNVIAGNTQNGINIDASDNNTIQGNWIGTTGTGSTGTGNDTGIYVDGSAGTIIGGTGTYDGNVITTNTNEGITITGSGATGTIIQGNIIGLDPDGATGGGNTDVGIALLSGANNTIIGGAVASARNIISNNYEGIEINSNNNIVQRNYIGTDITGVLDRGNRSDDGVEIQGSSTGNLIGGLAEGEGNLIAFNTLDGINVKSGSNTIHGNVIHSNSGTSIDLANNGATTNDSNDGDTGANQLQNYADITKAAIDHNQITISGTLNSIASTSYVVDFFASSVAGEAQVYLGSTTVTTNATNNGSFRAALNKTVALGQHITATATNLTTGSTSELSTSYQTTAAEASLWLSTKDDVTAAGTPGLDDWTEGEVLEFGDPGLAFEPTGTAGTFSSVFDLNPYFDDGDVDVAALHYVSTNITVGSGANTFDLFAGDVLFALEADELISGVTYFDNDVHVFRPDSVGDYSSGTISVLLDTLSTYDTRSITLVEHDTVVGDVTLLAGEFLYSDNNFIGEIRHFDAAGVGKGTTIGTRQTFLDSVGAFNLVEEVVGLELIEVATTIGGETLAAGTLLASVGVDDSVGNGGLNVADEDIFSLTVSTTKMFSGTSSATASMFMDSSLVNLSASAEDITAITLHPTNDSPTIATNTGTTVLEGSTGTAITTAMLNEGDPDDDGAELTYTVTDLTDNGTIYLSGFGALHLNDTFTQADIDAGDVTYDHNGSETTSDAFSFSLADGGEDGAIPAIGTFNFSITPVNDAPEIAAWYDSNWNYRKEIIVSAGQVSGDLVGFPILVDLNSDTELASFALGDGDDILFTSADGTTKLAHEIEVFTSGTGELVAWVKTDLSASQDSRLYMYYGNGSAANQQDATGVWDASYQGVWHLNNSPTGTAGEIVDSTSNNNDGVTEGSMDAADLVAAKIGTGLDFDEVDDLIRIADSASLDSTAAAATIEVWVNWDNVADGDHQILMTSSNRFTTGAKDGYEWASTGSGDHFYYPEGGTDPNYVLGSSPYTSGAWHHVALTQDFATKEVEIFVDGTAMSLTADTLATTWTTLADPADWLWGGNPDRATRYFDGMMDEIRVSNVVRSQDWIQASMSNQDDPNAFYSIGGAEARDASLTDVNEDDANPTGDTVASIIASVGGNLITDADLGAVEGIAVIGVDDTNGTWQYDSGGGWTDFGSVSNSSAVLLDATAKIRFVPDTDYNGSSGDITFRAWDTTDTNPSGTIGVNVSTNGGTTAYSSVTDSASLNVLPINDAPTVATNTGTTVLEGSTGTAITTAMLNEGDVDDGGAELTYTITNVTDNGTMYLAGFGALGLNDTFSQADIDAGDVTYDHNVSETTSDSFGFSLADGGENGSTPATGTFNFTVTPVNDNSPIINSDGGGASATVNILENSLYVSTVAATDADLPAETLTYSIVGGVDSTKFSIDSGSGVLTFVSAPDFESPTDVGLNNVYDVIVQVTDGALTDTQAIAVTVSDVSDSGQYLDLLNVESYSNNDGTENWSTNWVESDSIGGGSGNGNIDAKGGSFRIKLSSANDNVYREADLSNAVSATLSFTYASALGFGDAGQLAVQVSSNGGASYTTLPGATFDDTTNTGSGSKSIDISSHLAADTRIRLIVISGGGTKQIDVDNIQISYTPNSDPVITSNGGGATASVSVAENSTAVTTVTTSDADLPGQTLNYSIIGGVDATKFSIDSGSGALAFVAAPNFESPTDSGGNNVYDVVVQVSDGIATDTQAIAVTVTDFDEFDVGPVTDTDVTANAVDENATVGTVVGIDASASDADTTNNAITYSLADNDGGRFTINSSTGVVTVNGAIDREADGASRNITVRATSSDSSFTDQVFAIAINDVDEFNVGTVSDSNGTGNAVDEHAATNTVVGVTALAADADATNNTITYSLTDTAGGRFKIDSVSGVVTVDNGTLLNCEAAASHNITVRADSSDGSFDTAVMTINLNDVDEFDVGAVSDVDAAFNEVDENATVGTVVGVTAAAADADATTNTITYTLQDNDGGRFAIDSNSGVVTVAGAIDREADGASRNITIRATSADGSFTDQIVAININDVDEFDVGSVSDVDGTANQVNENATVGTVVGVTAAAADTDATTNTITYTLQDNDGGRFAIDSNSGVVTVAGAIDREADGASRNITIRATSADGSFTDQIVAININDVDEFDVGSVSDVDGTANQVAENATVGTVVGVTAAAADTDATTNTITYTLQDNDGGRFAIDSSSGVVTVAGAIDRETDGASRNITVRATSADGSFTDQVMAIAINDLDEFDVGPVSDGDATGNVVDENATVGTVVGVTVSASDADATTNTITYTLQDNDGGRFAIDSSTGIVTVAGAIDREADGASRNITVRATSADGSFTDQVIAININDVDEFDVGAITDANGTTDEVTENAGIGATVGITAQAADADATNNSILYTLDDDAGGRFAINGSTGEITVNAALDYETNTSHNVVVRAASSDGSSSTQAFTINVIDVSEFGATPIADSDGAIDSIAENAANGTAVGVTAFSDDADATDSITYSLDDNDGGRFTIDGSTGIVTVAGAIDREADGASRSITVRATSTDGSFQTRAFTIAIQDVDEFDVGAVTDADALANAVDENAANGSVVGVTALASDADATNNTITYTLDDSAGGRFAIDGSTGIVTVADGTLLDREAAASHNITVRATSSDGSSGTQVMTINVNDVDEFDVGLVSDGDVTANAVDENAIVGTTVGVTASASDADATTSTITYTLQDNDGGRFAIDSSSGVVTVAGAIDRETDGASRNITVRATSADGSFTDQVVAININDVDEFDVGVIGDGDATANAVNENAILGTTVGVTTSASDADATTNAIIYSLQDNDGGRFAIDSSSGVVTVSGAIDRETDGAARNITVRATSADGSFTDQVIAININDVDEFDVGAVTDSDATANEVDENATVGTVVGVMVSASDADATNNAIIYTLQDNDGGRFAIDSSTGMVTVAGAIDREADGASRNITVRATSADGSFTDQVVAISINDVDEFNVGAVTDSDLTMNAVDENAIVGTVVGVTASASDADATTNAITYTLQDNDGGRFAIDSSTGVVTVAGAINREADGASRNITVRATSADGSFTDQVIAISINDLDEFDATATADTDFGVNQVNENAIAGTTVGITTVATDADATNNTITYSLDDDDGGRFTIDASAGMVTVAGAIDREADGPTRSITVRSTSSDGSTTTQSFVITINDVDEFDTTATVDVDGSINAVDENAVVGTAVGITASASDADATNSTITYSLDDDDGGRFTIDGITGVISVAGAIDREADGASRSIVVRSTSSDASFTSAVFAIAINDVDEFDVTTPIDSDAAANFVNENSAVGTIVGLTAFADDPDANDSVNYSLSDNAGGRFAVDGVTGLVTVSGTLDYETAANHNITVRATSSDGSVSTHVFTINVGDVNEAPVASDDSYSVLSGNTMTLGVPGILVNDSDPDGDALTAILVTPPTSGSVTLLADGSLSYTSGAGFFGIDTLRYRVSDGGLLSNVVTIEITVIAGVPTDGGGPPDPDPTPVPDPTPDPEPEPDDEPADEAVHSAEANEPTQTSQSVARAVAAEQIELVLGNSSGSDRAMPLRQLGEAPIDAIAQGFFSQSSNSSMTGQQYSAQIEMLERLLQLDMEQAILWQQWDDGRDDFGKSPISYFVGSAGTAAGAFSVGYVLWALRGGAFATAMASSLPAWRLIDPTTILTAYRASNGPAQDRVEKMLTK